MKIDYQGYYYYYKSCNTFETKDILFIIKKIMKDIYGNKCEIIFDKEMRKCILINKSCLYPNLNLSKGLSVLCDEMFFYLICFDDNKEEFIKKDRLDLSDYRVIKEYIDFVINYRIENGLVTITKEELLFLLNSFYHKNKEEEKSLKLT